MKYFKDPITGKDWHCSDVFNWVAVDKDGSLFLYENLPEVHFKNSKWYWSGGALSFDLCAVQRDSFYSEFGKSLRRL